MIASYEAMGARMRQFLSTLLSLIQRKSWGSNFDLGYARKIKAELGAFNDCIQVHDLPKIYHYWSNKYLVPKFREYGITDPEQFFFLYASKYHASNNRNTPIRLVSIGSGNCDMEARLALRLHESGISNFSIDCLDINDVMLKRGIKHAEKLGVQRFIQPIKADFNHWEPTKSYDIVIANQCLHHVLELEKLFDAIEQNMVKGGMFLVSDMIGRNGHQRWPEALKLTQEFWQELPESYRYNRLLKRQEVQFVNRDCSADSFEGVRAQDVLPLLCRKFHFELFLPFANVIFAFIDRPFGHNFDSDGVWDRDFIDRVHARDEEGMLSGELKPTQMLAVLRKERTLSAILSHPKLTPEFCIRHVDS